MKIPIDDYAVIDLDAPVLPAHEAVVGGATKWLVWCKHCNTWHRHGPGVGAVALTPNEWIKAQRFGKDYWLYVVVNCKTQPELHLIQDPASKLNPKEEVSVVRYMVGQADWKKAACTADGALT